MKIFGFAGWSGSGKTTLIEKLIPRFAGAGLRGGRAELTGQADEQAVRELYR